MNIYLEDSKLKKNIETIEKMIEKYKIKTPITLFIIAKRKIPKYEQKQMMKKCKKITHIEKHKENKEISKEEMYKIASNQAIYKCRNSSCLGKTLYISKKHEISFCPYHIEETKIGTIDKIENTQIFEKSLKKMIEKRNKCKEKCEIYNICKGRCIFDEKCDKYKQDQLEVIKELNKLIADNTDLSTLPKYKEEAILNLIIRPLT